MDHTLVPVSIAGWTLGNPGPAGWAWLRNADTWAAGGIHLASAAEAELLAVATLLETAPPRTGLLVYSSSEYVTNVCGKWIRGWSKREWTRADGRPIQNIELVKRIWTAMEPRSYTRFEHVTPDNPPPNFTVAGQLASKAADRVAQNGRVDRVGPGWRQITVTQPPLI